MNTVKVTNRKLPRHSKTMKKMLSLRQEGWNFEFQIGFCFREQFGGSCLFTSVFGRETKAESCAGEMCSSKKIKMAEKCTKTRKVKSTSSTHQRRMSLTLNRARSSSEESTVLSVQDLQMASCSFLNSENALTSTAEV